MKIPGIDSSVRVDSKAMPVYLPGGENAVIIYHGYLGSPDDVITLAEHLNREGFTVFVPRLPGHGTSGNDFMTTGGRDWLRRAFDSCAEINGKYKNTIIAGFSMGGLLAIIAASVFRPDGLVLVAPAVTNKRRLKIHLAPLMMLFKKRIRRNKKSEAESSFDRFLEKEYWSYDWPAAAWSILRMQKEAVKRLRQIRCRTFLLISEADNTVPVKAGEIVAGSIDGELLDKQVLKKSGHMILKGAEKEKASRLIAEWAVKTVEKRKNP